MTVSELIEKLREMPPQLEVFATNIEEIRFYYRVVIVSRASEYDKKHHLAFEQPPCDDAVILED